MLLLNLGCVLSALSAIHPNIIYFVSLQIIPKDIPIATEFAAAALINPPFPAPSSTILKRVNNVAVASRKPVQKEKENGPIASISFVALGFFIVIIRIPLDDRLYRKGVRCHPIRGFRLPNKFISNTHPSLFAFIVND